MKNTRRPNQFSDRNKDVLMNDGLLISGGSFLSLLSGLSLSPNSSLSWPQLVGWGGGLVCESVGKADLLSDHFDANEYRESMDSAVHLPSIS